MTTYIAATYPAVGVVRVPVGFVAMTFDYPVRTYHGTKAFAGTVYDTSGSTVSGATVVLFRDYDNLACAVTTSDGSGNYSFTRDDADPNTYFTRAYTISGGTQVHGTSDRGVAPS